MPGLFALQFWLSLTTSEALLIGAAALYAASVSWGKAHNARNLVTGTCFGKKLIKRFPKIHTRQGAAYQGIRLIDLESE